MKTQEKFLSESRKFRNYHKIGLDELRLKLIEMKFVSKISIATLSNYERLQTKCPPKLKSGIMTALNLLRDENNAIDKKATRGLKKEACRGCSSVPVKNNETCGDCATDSNLCINCEQVVGLSELGNICKDCFEEIENEKEYRTQLNPINHV